MKKIIFLLTLLVFISCNKDETGDAFLSIEILALTDHEITIKWISNENPAETVYRVVLNGNVVAENRRENYLTIEDLEDNTNYNLTVFAIRQDQTQIFSDLSFTTELDLSFDGDLILGTQEGVDNVYFTSVTGRLIIFNSEIVDLTNLSVLEKVGSLTIQNTILESLNGLHNISSMEYIFNRTEIIINGNENLADISAIHELSNDTQRIYIFGNPSLTNLAGLNIKEGGIVQIYQSSINSFVGAFENVSVLVGLLLEDNPNLLSLNGLQNISEINNISLVNMKLSNLNGLNNLTKMGSLGFRDLEQLTSIQELSGAVMESGVIKFTNLPNLISLDGLNNVEKVKYINFIRLYNITNVDAFSNLHSNSESEYFELEIRSCNALTNLDGFANLLPLNEPGSYRFILQYNNNLSDFCGLRNIVTALLDGPQFLGWSVDGNTFNPTREMVRDGNCSQ